METRAIEMKWFAVLNENDIVEEVMQMPAGISGDAYIVIPEEDRSLIGKRYNRQTGEFETAVYYYAVLDERGIVTEILVSPNKQTCQGFVEIDAQDLSLVGKWYDEKNQQFIEPPISVLAAHSTNEISYKKEEKWLSDKLDEMDAAIAAAEGKAGQDGKSAYEIAVDSGYNGSEAEWLDSLKGKDGVQGPIGPQGPKGEIGAAGVQGLQGPKGDKGDAGVPGCKGDAGPMGPVGPRGPKGETGAMGPVGPKGERGEAGVAGPQGLKGEKGDIGPAGPVGPAGVDGSAFCVEQGSNYRKYADGTAIVWGSSLIDIAQNGYKIVNLPISLKNIYGFSCPPAATKRQLESGVTNVPPGLAVLNVTDYNSGSNITRIAIGAAYGSIYGTNWTVWGTWR